MNHTTQTIATLDTSLAPLRCRHDRPTGRSGRREGQLCLLKSLFLLRAA
jgi:hypothetical protein